MWVRVCNFTNVSIQRTRRSGVEGRLSILLLILVSALAQSCQLSTDGKKTDSSSMSSSSASLRADSRSADNEAVESLRAPSVLGHWGYPLVHIYYGESPYEDILEATPVLLQFQLDRTFCAVNRRGTGEAIVERGTFELDLKPDSADDKLFIGELHLYPDGDSSEHEIVYRMRIREGRLRLRPETGLYWHLYVPLGATEFEQIMEIHTTPQRPRRRRQSRPGR
jgi:hypothetical protein